MTNLSDIQSLVLRTYEADVHSCHWLCYARLHLCALHIYRVVAGSQQGLIASVLRVYFPQKCILLFATLFVQYLVNGNSIVA